MRKLATLGLLLSLSAAAAGLPSGGLGLTKVQWTSLHSVTGSGPLGPVYDRQYSVAFAGNRVTRIVMDFNAPGPSPDTAQQLARVVMPADARFVGQDRPISPSGRQVFRFRSRWLHSDLLLVYSLDELTASLGIRQLTVLSGNRP